MKRIITIYHLNRLIKWTTVLFGLLLIRTLIAKRNIDGIKCTNPEVLNLTNNEIKNQCLDEHYSYEEHIFHIFLHRENKKSIEHEFYESNYNKFHTNLFFLIYQFLFAKIFWHFRPKFSRSEFKIDDKSKNRLDNDDKKLLIELNKDDILLFESFKKVMKKKGKKLNFKLNCILMFIACSTVYFSLIIISLSTNISFIKMGFKELIRLLYNSNWKTSFPDLVQCNVEKRFFEEDPEYGYSDSTIYGSVICKLTLNGLYLASYLLIWLCLILLTIIVTISLIQFIILSKSNLKRLKRLSKLLPFVDIEHLKEFANNRYSFFIIEALNAKLDNIQFQKLINLIVNENYRLDNTEIETETINV